MSISLELPARELPALVRELVSVRC